MNLFLIKWEKIKVLFSFNHYMTYFNNAFGNMNKKILLQLQLPTNNRSENKSLNCKQVD